MLVVVNVVAGCCRYSHGERKRRRDDYSSYDRDRSYPFKDMKQDIFTALSPPDSRQQAYQGAAVPAMPPPVSPSPLDPRHKH